MQLNDTIVELHSLPSCIHLTPDVLVSWIQFRRLDSIRIRFGIQYSELLDGAFSFWLLRELVNINLPEIVN